MQRDLMKILFVGVFALLAVLLLPIGYGLWPALQPHLWALGLILLMAYAALYVWRRSQRRRLTRATLVLVIAGLILLASNATYFFILNPHSAAKGPFKPLGSVCEAVNRPFLVRAGQTKWHLPQPVNAMLISDQDGAALMTDLGWIQNLTFSRDQIGFKRFISLIAAGTPPVSELYLDGQPADSAFQLPGNLSQREHIRWWAMGAGVHFGAISKDEELAIKYYGSLPVVLHDIDPQTDASRNLLGKQVAQSGQFTVAGWAQLGPIVTPDEQWDYTSDGRILIITERGVDLPAEIIACLGMS